MRTLKLNENKLTKLFVNLLNNLEDIEAERCNNNESYFEECLKCALKKSRKMAMTSHDIAQDICCDLTILTRKGID